MLDVVIVGAGPIGLFLALVLRRQGLNVEVLERRDGPVFDPRAAIIWPRTAEVLSAQGLAPAFRHERRLLEGVELHVGGRRRGVLRLRGLAGPESVPWIIEQHRTEVLLRAQLGEGVIRGAHTFKALTQHDDRVRAVVDTPNGESTVEARYLVGCDGARSLVRKHLGIEFMGRAHEGLECLQVNAECAWERPPRDGFCRFDLIPHATSLAVPLPERGFRFISFQRSRGPLRVPALADTEAQLSAIVGQSLRLSLTTPGWHTRARFQDRIAKTLHVGRVLLCGDAAAVWAPIGGRGMNVGLLAADRLGHALAAVIRARASEALLAAYDAEVRRMARSVIRTLAWNRLEYPSGPLALFWIDLALRLASAQDVVPRPIERLLSLASLAPPRALSANATA